jgi:GTP-binding protein
LFTIADLPGYGYAKVSREAQARWQKNLEEYLLKREQIKTLIQFIDARHEIQKNDFQMREWVEAYNLPIITIVTKIDYVPRGKHLKILSVIKKKLSGDVLLFSATDRQYCEKVLEHLLNLCEND